MQQHRLLDVHWHGFWTWVVAIALIVLLILLWLFGLGPGRPGCCTATGSGPAATGSAAASTPAPAPPMAHTASAASATSATASAPASTPASLPASAPSAAAAAAPSSAPVAAAEAPPTANLYFALGSSALSVDSRQALAPIIAWLKAHPGARAVISGYHDASGNAQINAELAKRRAQAVQARLTLEGIARDRIELRKPQVTTGSGSDAEARRVEVTITP